MNSQFLEYLRYRLFAKHRKGFGIHSPFVFDLITRILNKEESYAELDKIMAWHKGLLRESTLVKRGNFGAGSKRLKEDLQPVSGIIKNSAIKPKYGRILFQLVQEFQPERILELGTGSGVSTAYLAGPGSGRILSVEGEKSKHDFATRALKNLGYEHLELVLSEFDDFLQDFQVNSFPFLAFIDGNHRGDALRHYFRTLLPFCKDDTILVFDDIHWSKDMYRAWKEIVQSEKATLSIDFFFMGILFFKKGRSPQHFVVQF